MEEFPRILKNLKRTCKNSSSVDYFSATAHVFEFINTFEIEDFNCLYPISLAINIRDVPLTSARADQSTNKHKYMPE